jgi:hypothetical protein
VVFEGDELIEARLHPVVLDNYRPVPLVGAAARSVLQSIEESSVLEIRSERIGGAVRRVLSPFEAETDPPTFIYERNTALVEQGPGTPTSYSVTAAFHPRRLVGPALTRSRAPGGLALPGVLLGRDIFRWGGFEDDGADTLSGGGMHWETNDSYKRIEVLSTGPSGVRGLRLRRTSENVSRVLARPRARVSFTPHRIFEDLGGGETSPIDGDATYSVRFFANLEGDGQPILRLDVYHFDDTNPTADPESSLLRSKTFPLELTADGEWEEVVFDIPAPVFSTSGSLEANAMLFYFGLESPAEGTSVFLVDEIAILEWRAADDLPDGYYAIDSFRSSADGETVDAVLERLE